MIKDRLIGIMGKKHSGKTEVAKYLISHYGFTRISFADPLKNMLLTLGLTQEQLYGNEKEIPLDILGGQTSRHAMQTLGTEWGRNLIHGDIWVNAWKLMVKKCKTLVVVDDLRFVNEGKAIEELSGKIILIERPGLESEDIHLSEIEMNKIPHDEKILNDGSLIELAAKVGELIEKSEHTVRERNLSLPAKDWEPKQKRGAFGKDLKQERAKFLRE